MNDLLSGNHVAIDVSDLAQLRRFHSDGPAPFRAQDVLSMPGSRVNGSNGGERLSLIQRLRASGLPTIAAVGLALLPLSVAVGAVVLGATAIAAAKSMVHRGRVKTQTASAASGQVPNRDEQASNNAKPPRVESGLALTADTALPAGTYAVYSCAVWQSLQGGASQYDAASWRRQQTASEIASLNHVTKSLEDASALAAKLRNKVIRPLMKWVCVPSFGAAVVSAIGLAVAHATPSVLLPLAFSTAAGAHALSLTVVLCAAVTPRAWFRPSEKAFSDRERRRLERLEQLDATDADVQREAVEVIRRCTRTKIGTIQIAPSDSSCALRTLLDSTGAHLTPRRSLEAAPPEAAITGR